MADGAQALCRLDGLARQAHAVMVGLVDAVGQVKRSGTVEHIEGLPLEACLAVSFRLPRADVAMLLGTVEVLPSMPVTDGLFRDGRLSWAMVRGIVAQCA